MVVRFEGRRDDVCCNTRVGDGESTAVGEMAGTFDSPVLKADGKRVSNESFRRRDEEESPRMRKRGFATGEQKRRRHDDFATLTG